MHSTKIKIDKFIGFNDFGLCRLKKKTLLVQHNLLEVLKDSYRMDVSLAEKENTTMIVKSHNVIILSLGAKILRQVSKEKIVVGGLV